MNIREKQELKEQKFLDEKASKSSNATRWKEEIKDEFRTEYQRDIGRILFSDAFRRLRMKTQIFSAKATDQHNRTRLTHSLEVAQIAKSISNALNLNNDLVEAIALGHDLGHTPFGHAGEEALNNCLINSEAHTTFNHNAQSVWLVIKTLANRKDINGKSYPGFNLTFDVIEGIWKHTKIEETLTDFEDLSTIRSLNHNNSNGSLEAQIVNLSDGIAYIRHDIEDAVRNKIIKYDEFINEIWKNNFDSDFDPQNWINFFVYNLITNNQNLDKITFSSHYENVFKEIKNFIFNRVIKSDTVKKEDEENKEKITHIFNYCIKNPDYLSKKYNNGYKTEKYGIERTITDFIQWCGDELANKIYNDTKSKQYNT